MDKPEIKIGEYTIRTHSDSPDGENLIWIENGTGEGTTVRESEVAKLFKSVF